jgi:hypothetical protein
MGLDESTGDSEESINDENFPNVRLIFIFPIHTESIAFSILTCKRIH